MWKGDALKMRGSRLDGQVARDRRPTLRWVLSMIYRSEMMSKERQAAVVVIVSIVEQGDNRFRVNNDHEGRSPSAGS